MSDQFVVMNFTEIEKVTQLLEAAGKIDPAMQKTICRVIERYVNPPMFYKGDMEVKA